MSRRLIIEADGGSRGNPGPAGFGAVVRDADGPVLTERSGFIGQATNNVAEYRGLLAGIKAARSIDPEAELDIRLDSKLVVCQMDGSWKIKSPDLRELAIAARTALGDAVVKFTWVPRDQNAAADSLANRAMDRQSGYQPPLETSGRFDLERPAEVVGPAESITSGSAVRQGQSAFSGSQSFFGLTSEPVTVVLVRHGMTDLTKKSAFAGERIPGARMGSLGHKQAVAAANELINMLEVPWAFLTPPVVLFASPTARTLQTAREFGFRLGLDVYISPHWSEENFGQWDSLTKDQVESTWPGQVQRWFTDPDFAPPDGESRAAVGRRAAAALHQLVTDYPGQTVLVVTHTITIRAAIGAALGLPPSVWFGFRISPASISVLRVWDQAHTEVVCLNRTVAPAG
ncbi:MAG: bifunctional RNase H/acid phosphatase [Micrococcales bacterium]|nr:bifunctional RNase H/acid phosphatase [Micrococcales bacterium]